jgi:hypothetical protein
VENERRDASYFKETGSNAVPDAGGKGSERCDIFLFFLKTKNKFSIYPLSQVPGTRYMVPGVQYGTKWYGDSH